jgi:uridine kinase
MIIGIGGGTGSGKTTLSKKIIETVGHENVLVIEQDSYYKDLVDMPLDERRQANFDHPDSVDLALLAEHLKTLKAGQAVDMPVYDFRTHTRSAEVNRADSKPVIILEGILIYADQAVAEQIDVKIFVDTPDDIRFIRRLQRDISERGRTADSVIAQYFATVRPMHSQFVEPSRRRADLILPEHGNWEVGIDFLCSRIREEVERTGELK